MEALPTELKTLVASFVTDPQALISLALTNKEFYGVVKYDEAKFCDMFCTRDIGREIFPLALALADSRTLAKWYRAVPGQPQYPLDMSVREIIAFVDRKLPRKASDPDDNPYSGVNLALCAKLFTSHVAFEKYASIIAEAALAAIPGPCADRGDCSEREMQRVRKSLYIMQLFSNVFPRGCKPASTIRRRDRSSRKDLAWRHLWAKFAPWELQQVRCSRTLLAMHIQQGKAISKCLTITDQG